MQHPCVTLGPRPKQFVLVAYSRVLLGPLLTASAQSLCIKRHAFYTTKATTWVNCFNIRLSTNNNTFHTFKRSNDLSLVKLCTIVHMLPRLLIHRSVREPVNDLWACVPTHSKKLVLSRVTSDLLCFPTSYISRSDESLLYPLNVLICRHTKGRLSGRSVKDRCFWRIENSPMWLLV